MTLADFNIFNEYIVYSPWLKLPSKDWETLTSLGKRQFYKRNVLLYSSNQFSDYVYLVDSGRVEIYIVNSEGDKKVIGICDKGALFGEIQLFDSKPNHCTARVCKDAWIYKIVKNDFMDAIFKNNNLMRITLEGLATKIRILYTQIEFLSFKTSTAKVALVLISMCKDFGVKVKDGYKLNINFTHNDIANMTGLSRVSVSNILINLINLGVLRKEGSEYFIADIHYLKQLVE